MPESLRNARRPLLRTVRLCLVASICWTGACAPNVPDNHLGKTADSLRVALRVEHLDTLAREPMLVEHPSGALFVSGYNAVRPALWRSLDGGTRWERIELGTAADGAIGNSDVDLTVAPDGTLYLAQMMFEPDLYEGRGISVGVSLDTGTTWRWTSVSRVRFDDRPWLAVAPDGTVHLVWNDDRGVQHARSTDRGATWRNTGRVHPRGGSSHFAIGPAAELAVRVTPAATSGNQCHPDTDLVVVSMDGGDTWQSHPAPGLPRADGCPSDDKGEIPRWVDPLAWDSAGMLHALWTDSTGVWLGRSPDRGATWRSGRIVERLPGEPVPYYPFLAARGRGELAATWFVGTDDPLSWRAARITARTDSIESWQVQLKNVTPLESWRPATREPNEGGEYLPVKFLRDGRFAVVTPIQHHSAKRLGFTWWIFTGR